MWSKDVNSGAGDQLKCETGSVLSKLKRVSSYGAASAQILDACSGGRRRRGTPLPLSIWHNLSLYLLLIGSRGKGEASIQWQVSDQNKGSRIKKLFLAPPPLELSGHRNIFSVKSKHKREFTHIWAKKIFWIESLISIWLENCTFLHEVMAL